MSSSVGGSSLYGLLPSSSSSSSFPSLESDEVLLKLYKISKVSFFLGLQREDKGESEVALTNRRLMFGSGRDVPLVTAVVENLEGPGIALKSLLKSSYKAVVYHGCAAGDLRLALSFGKKAERDEFVDRMCTAIGRKEWEDTAATGKPVRMESFKTSGAGVGGILRKHEERQVKEQKLASEAFDGDLENLMRRAKEVVAVVERLRSKIDKAEEDGKGLDSEAAGLNDLLRSMGMVRGVSKDTAGSRFHDMIRGEIVDFLLSGPGGGRLKKAGGIMTLPEIYCLYNRARGGDLISPGDLLEVAQGLKGADVDLELRRFENGVLCMQTKQLGYDSFAEKIGECCRDRHGGPINPSFLAERIKCTVQLAKLMLEEEVKKGGLCRDETIQGVSYWENKFVSFYDALSKGNNKLRGG